MLAARKRGKRLGYRNCCAIALLALLSAGCPEGNGGSETRAAADCDRLAPRNPYVDGSGHYAGFEWAEANRPGVCGGNSDSFIEGCEDYERKLASYNACLNKR